MSVNPSPGENSPKPIPAATEAGVAMAAATIPSEPFHPQCRIFSIQKLAARDAALRKQGLFVKADELRTLVARALCYPYPVPAHLLGGVL